MLEKIIFDRPSRPEKGNIEAEVSLSGSNVDLELGVAYTNCHVLLCKWYAVILISIRDMMTANDFHIA